MNSCNTNEKQFERIDIKDLKENTFELFNDNWFVVTAGEDNNFNPMTISWGGFGILWGYPVATIYIRDSRYTYQFIDEGHYFTLCAFDEEYRDKASYFGTVSGRDEDKIKNSGLTPQYTLQGNMYFKEARLVIECEKIFFNDMIKENILDDKARDFYSGAEEAYHTMFVGKIINVWEKK
ncbi:flavin reductase [Bacteroidales bacterium OttesenSCG-928-K03]|nr:flavin reductase [Odoribacter sp. OttesenSCG-928-L07]MDL2242437.1 flavin reductase [Bacteroidales bacterium OttesenSCG-928-K03]